MGYFDEYYIEYTNRIAQIVTSGKLCVPFALHGGIS